MGYVSVDNKRNASLWTGSAGSFKNLHPASTTQSAANAVYGGTQVGWRVMAILDNSPYSTVPSTVTVPPGATQVIFNIATLAVTSQKTVTVTARVSAGEKTGTFKINP